MYAFTKQVGQTNIVALGIGRNPITAQMILISVLTEVSIRLLQQKENTCQPIAERV